MAVDYRSIARRKAKKYGLDPDIFERQIGAESNFNPRAVSPAGARGIAQIMPATAEGWGVDPMDPEAALDAAARNMAAYVRRYGSYENALRAYNAGPGAIEKSKQYNETNAYVAKILGGRDPGKLSKRRGTPTSTVSATNTSREPAESRISRMIDIFAKMNESLGDNSRQDENNSVGVDLDKQLAQGWKLLRQRLAPAEQPQTQAQPTIAPSRGGGRVRGIGGRLLESFLNLPGAINVDEHRRVPKGFVSGHTGHYHVAAGPKSILRIMQLAREAGLNAGEYGATTGHAPGSFHGRKQAADITGPREKLIRFNRRIAKLYGLG